MASAPSAPNGQVPVLGSEALGVRDADVAGHQGLAGTPAQGFAMVASPGGNACITTAVWRG